TVKLEIPDEILCVSVDALLIEQVIINLLENAVIHADGMTELSLTVHVVGEYAVFEIADNGSGIPAERFSNLFTGYHDRTDAPTDGKRSNMGIGLSVCATIIRAHGGTIRAENRPQGGAVFRFTLETEEVDLE
ncbi:MAG: ATP-binding protein, partial [Butyricicoccus sp.]|nr:ATP-binding protein [Butyricicoccus sp.]